MLGDYFLGHWVHQPVGNMFDSVGVFINLAATDLNCLQFFDESIPREVIKDPS